MALKFIKENFALTLGLTLPALLMVGFMLVSTLPGSMAPPPQHDLVFATPDYRSGPVPHYVNLTVKDGFLYAKYSKTSSPNHQPTYSYAWKKLYLFDSKTQSLRQLTFDTPQEPKEGVDILVEATKGMKLDTHTKAPDGYELTQGGYRNGGLISELFWGSSRHQPRLKKGSFSIKLPDSANQIYYSYYDMQFLGWVVEKTP